MLFLGFHFHLSQGRVLMVGMWCSSSRKPQKANVGAPLSQPASAARFPISRTGCETNDDPLIVPYRYVVFQVQHQPVLQAAVPRAEGDRHTAGCRRSDCKHYVLSGEAELDGNARCHRLTREGGEFARNLLSACWHV